MGFNGASGEAEQAFRKGDFATAERLCNEVLQGSPEDALAHRVLGMTLARTGRSDEAIQHFKQALRAQPNDFLSLEWLQGTLMQTGRYGEAVEFGEKARSLRPRDVNILIGLSQACFKAGLHVRGVQCLETVRGIEPGNAAVHHLLGQGYERLKRNRDAMAEYREAIRLNPRLGDAYDRANRILLEEGRFAAALRLCEQAFVALSEYGPVRLQAAKALWALGRSVEAGVVAEQAVQLDPSLAWAAATWLQSCGRLEAANAMLERSIRDRPVQGRAYLGIVKGRRIMKDDRRLIELMESLLAATENPTPEGSQNIAQGQQTPGRSTDQVQRPWKGRTPSASQAMPPKERVALLRALGKASDDLGAYEAAMGYFDEAARLGIEAFGTDFDPGRLDAARESFLRIFDQDFLARNANLGRSDVSPIFVIGMIRSGTTLVQQILTSHPNIGDAGEQPYWTTEFPAIVDLDRGELRPEAFVESRDRYLEVLKRFDPDAPMVANKWPMNYAHAGLLLLAYPGAKIIHIARDPLDTVLSIWMTDLGEPRPEFSYKKRHIVSVYRDYQTRMRHWDRVLPAGSILTVRYEDLVADQETWSRRMIEFCGQPWDARCLAFHEGERRVNTPSMLQVRSPIYGSSVGKWRRYEPWLGEFAVLRSE
jgi:tetratricopeptide (TPR) repeat protein